MLDIVTKGITKLFGNKSDKDIKKVLPIVEKINQVFATMSGLSDDDLRAKTQEIKAVIQADLKSIDDQLKALHDEVGEAVDMDIHQKEEIFDKIDDLEKKRNEEIEVTLKKVLPDAFALIKETARRFKENKQLTVKANLNDKQIAARKSNVVIEGDNAIWHNKWLAAGNEITWEMVHYDVQLIGGIILHEGKIAEMATGEGKTLVATLPSFLNALANRGVHIVTVNDYLAKRDSEWMAPIMEFHGLTVDCIDNHDPNSEQRRKAYQADITYGTNNEFGFDYLRDNMARDPEELVQRNHHFAMVDEVDSVLIDEARTPLIISGPIPKGDDHEYDELKPRVAKLVEAQKKIVSQYLIDAKKQIAEEDEKNGGLALFRAFRGLPKYKPLIKYLSEVGRKQILNKTENFYLQDNSKMMPEADAPLYFTIDEKNNTIDLTEKGLDLLTGESEDADFFILPDIGMKMNDIDNNEALSDDDKLQQKDDIIKSYSAKAERIHTVNQLLKAYTLFEKDVEYIIADDKVKIVDEQTGRVMDGRRYSDGLHQAIEAKENVKVEDATQTYATVTLQNYFRMYHKLSGMTGTAETEAGEFWEIYKLDCVIIPTNKPIIRDDREDKVYKTVREKFNAVADEIVELTKANRPVLVGTTSVEISELVSRMLNIRNIKHQTLNAKQHQREADIVAEAGKPGTVTIATNMAGRGTDIKLLANSKESGGLAIIGTERHESRRVDRQLRGRSGRQGDPGSSQFFVSLEDNLMRMFMSERVTKIMDRLGLQEGEVIQHSMVSKSIERAQKKVEENNFAIRKRLLEYDDVMNSQREVIYKRRKNALYGERLELDILTMLFETCEDIVINAKASEDYDSFKLNCLGILGIDFPMDQDSFASISNENLSEQLYDNALEHYEAKNNAVIKRSIPIFKDIEKNRGATVENVLVPFTDGKKQIGVVSNLKENIATDCKALIKSMEKMITLAIIDQAWKEHLREMDDLKQSVQNAVYEQKDPLLIYKFESFELFKRFLARVNEDTVAFLMKADIPVHESDEVHEARTQRTKQKYSESKEESKSLLSGGESSGNRPPAQKNTTPAKSTKIAGRNDKVTVQYTDGSVKKNVKFKTVAEDIANNKCVLIEE